QARRNWLIERDAKSMVMYWWHDEMSGQLNFSLVSLCHGKLPFGCKVILRYVKSLEDIVNEWFASPYLHGIPWSEFSDCDPDEPDEPEIELPPLEQNIWLEVLP
ncbi:MAG: hypothetical protein ACF8OB_01840, partial [Phycisphaeraceae bacterium JB051]